MLKGQDITISLPDAVVNIDEKSRSNLFNWRGQFSPQLIESLLQAYANKESRIFDPFLGSGTVLYEAALLGLSAAGSEINPAAVAFAKIYELSNEKQSDRDVAVNIIDEIISCYSFEHSMLQAKPISNIEPELLAAYNNHTNDIVRKILKALIVGLDFEAKKIDAHRLIGTWGALRSNIKGLPNCTKKIACFEADARKTPAKDNSYNLVVTSPPYINVFNYHQNYRKSVELLGIDVLSIARSEIGSNRKFRGNRFLTVVQYCMDMAQVLEELKRICTSDAKIIFIVGRESNVKKTAFYNAQLLKEVALQCNLSLRGQQHRVFNNKFGQAIYEEIMRFSILDKTPLHDASEKARLIGINALKVAENHVDEEVREELLDAIKKSEQINSSPYLGE